MDNHSPCGTLTPLPSPATRASAAVFVERGERIKMAAEMGLARSSRGRHWSRALRRRILRTKRGRSAAAGCGCEDEPAPAPAPATPKVSGAAGGVEATAREEEEEVEVEKRVRTLQKLVPGGEELGVERLFEETADYIEALQGQVSVMRTLAVLLDGLEREKRMAGGG